jgi:TolB protein
VVRKLAAAALLCVVLSPSSSAVASSDIGVVAFTSDRDGNSEIYTSRIDGIGQTNLTRNPAVDQSPAFSAKGDKIAFISDRDGRMDVWVMNADGSDAHKVTTGDGNTSDAEPSWSPDGTKLAFSSSRSGDGWHLFIVDLATGAITRLTSGWGVSPAWSPDGTRIAYADGNAIKLIDADGMNDRFLTCACLGPEGSPTWSPSGGNIVFGRYDQDWQTTNVRQLYIMSANGGDALPITSGAYYHGHPSFSPDGSMLVFQRQDGAFGSPELYAMRLSDLSPWPSVTSPGRNFVPSWGRTFVAPPPPPPPADTPTRRPPAARSARPPHPTPRPAARTRSPRGWRRSG